MYWSLGSEPAYSLPPKHQIRGAAPGADQPEPNAASIDAGRRHSFRTVASVMAPGRREVEKGPDLLRSVLVLDDENGKSIGHVILAGRADKGMPKFAMTPEQITDISNFLHDSIKSAANRDSYQILNIVIGDPKAGEAGHQRRRKLHQLPFRHRRSQRHRRQI